MSNTDFTSTPWADTPFSLILTPGRSIDLTTSHASIFIAREMACAHNGMLRALNSIYNQCLYVSSPTDIHDLVMYTKFWIDWIHEHHEAEEKMFFVDVERITGVKDWGSANVLQHESFMKGLHDLEKYVNTLLDGGKELENEYDGAHMRGLIDAFAPDLATHLNDEIGTLLALKPFDGPKLRQAYDEFDLELRKGDKSILFPIVLGTGDSSYEEGFEWPVIPGFLRYVVHYWFERKWSGVWRFSPSTTWGEKRALAFGPQEDE